MRTQPVSLSTSGRRQLRVRRVSTAAAALAIATVLAGCSGAHGGSRIGETTPKSGSGSPPIEVQTVAVSVGPLIADRQTAGTVESSVRSNVAALEGGVVLKVFRSAGDTVQQNDPVLALNDTQLQFAVRNAQAALANAKINLSTGEQNTTADSPKLQLQLQSAQSSLSVAQKNYDTQVALLGSGGATQSSVDNAKSQLDQAKASVQAAQSLLDQNQRAGTQNIAQLKLAVDQAQTQLDQANYNLNNAIIRAPFAGQIVSVNVQNGEYLPPNGTAFVLASRTRNVSFNIPPGDSSDVQDGSPVTFMYNGASFALTVTEAAAAPVGGVIAVVAGGSSVNALPNGAVGTIQYKVELANGTHVPINSVQTQDNRNFVFSVVGNQAHAIAVTLLAESGGSAAVSGLADGAVVVIDPPTGLLDGAAVDATAAKANAGGAGGTANADGSK